MDFVFTLDSLLWQEEWEREEGREEEEEEEREGGRNTEAQREAERQRGQCFRLVVLGSNFLDRVMVVVELAAWG